MRNRKTLVTIMMSLGSSYATAQASPLEVSPASFVAHAGRFTDTLYSRGRVATKQIEGLIISAGRDQDLWLYTVEAANGASRDSVWLIAGSLTPIRHVAVAGGALTDVRFSTDSVVGVRTDSTAVHRVARALGRPAFDFSTLPLILRHLPAAPGTRGLIHTVDIDQGMRDLPFVAAPETVSEAGEPSGLVRITVDFGRWKTVYRIQPDVHAHFGYDMLVPNRPPVAGARRTLGS